MVVYEEYKIYGPYIRKDGRKHLVLIKHSDDGKIIERKTISYPKYLVEKYMGKYIDSDDTIDHIDGNVSNNSLSNLRIIKRSLHIKSHSKVKEKVIKKCVICGKVFETNNNWRLTCGSKRCAGKCTHVNGYNCGHSFKGNMNNLISNRSLVEEIQSVEGAKSGKPLIGNPEQED